MAQWSYLDIVNVPFHIIENVISQVQSGTYWCSRSLRNITLSVHSILPSLPSRQSNVCGQRDPQRSNVLHKGKQYDKKGNIEGVVTKVTPLGGEINGGVYRFTQDVNKRVPPLHSLVRFDAERLSTACHEFWTVTRLECISQQESGGGILTTEHCATDNPDGAMWQEMQQIYRDEEEANMRLLQDQTEQAQQARRRFLRHVGMVTQIHGENAVLNDSDEYTFPLSACVDQFTICHGDWVILEYAPTKKDSEEEGPAPHHREVLRVYPLRMIAYEGHISAYRPGNRSGVIAGRIIFMTRTLPSACRPQDLHMNDLVEGVAIESSQGNKLNHRALTVNRVDVRDRRGNEELVLKPLTISQWLQGDGTLDEGFRAAHSVGLQFGFDPIDMGSVEMGRTTSRIVSLTRISANDKDIVLQHARVQGLNQSHFGVRVIVGHNEESASLPYNWPVSDGPSEVRLQITCHAKVPGRDELSLVLEGATSGEESENFSTWKVRCRLMVNVMLPVEQMPPAVTAPVGRYRHPRQSAPRLSRSDPLSMHSSRVLLPGQKLFTQRSQITKYIPHNLSQYPVPAHLRRIIEEHFGSSSSTVLKEALCKTYATELRHMNSSTSMSTAYEDTAYRAKWRLLLQVEEVASEMELQRYNMMGVQLLHEKPRMLRLQVEGLQQGRPSLQTGDRVNVECVDCPALPSLYEGYVHEVHAEGVELKFHNIFHDNYTNQFVNVNFIQSRTMYRRQHRAVEWSSHLGAVVLGPRLSLIQLKPPQTCISSMLSGGDDIQQLEKVTFYHTHLNTEQKQAVLRILQGHARPTPYVIYGPPGTGKTITLTEAVLQVYDKVASSRLLVCAPSNSAADLVCQRLMAAAPHMAHGGIFVRLIAYRRSIQDASAREEVIPDDVLPHCRMVDQVRQAAMHRIMVCTSSCAGVFYDLQMEVGHFTHVFLDEAGQATEPETLIALGLVAESGGQIVLAGDPQQLGPVVLSNVASELGLGDSFLHRLLTQSQLQEVYGAQYDENPTNGSSPSERYNPLFVTRLVRNYRAHSGLLHIYSSMFYGNDLLCMAPHEDVTSVVRAAALYGLTMNDDDDRSHTDDDDDIPHIFPNAEFPLVVHGVRGEETREADSPSYMNYQEALLIVQYAVRFVQQCEVPGSKLGIVTPYRKQVEKIRVLLRSMLPKESFDVKVGSVEEFQGQERDVILLSTVRSSALAESVGQGIMAFLDDGMGFLTSPRRFNVAVSRAKKALVVVGNPLVLCKDSCWRALVHYAVKNGGYHGCDVSAVPELVGL